MKKRSIIDYIWFFLLAFGILLGLVKGREREIFEAAVSYSGKAVELSLSLIGTMSLWLGIMEIAKDSGLTDKLSKFLSPLICRLFPSIPKGHPAVGAITMNMASNLLGLGNAATPFGLKAIKELSKLNGEKEVPSSDMILFIVINTASLTLIPSNIIAMRASTGSNDPGIIISPVIITSLISITAGIILCKILSKRRGRKL